jgi:hypothetical protein
LISGTARTARAKARVAARINRTGSMDVPEGHIGGCTEEEKARSIKEGERIREAGVTLESLPAYILLCLDMAWEKEYVGWIGDAKRSHCERTIYGLFTGDGHAKHDSLDVIQAVNDQLLA